MHTYHHAVLGGTFDHLHAGHHSHLSHAAEAAPRLTIGLTTEEMLARKQFASSIEPYEERERAVRRWFAENAVDTMFEIVPISDIYGPAGYVSEYDALIATESTRQNALRVNVKRHSQGVGELPIVLAPEIASEDGVLISSTRIRAGEIDRQGHVYHQLFAQDVRLPASLRASLREPIGALYQGVQTNWNTAAALAQDHIRQANAPLVVTVGDVVSECMIDDEWSRSMRIIDYRTQRIPHQLAPELFDVQNEAGTISQNAVKQVNVLIQSGAAREVIRVDGEEDLLVIPAVLLAPLGSIVLYGQPNEGIVVIDVDEAKKSEITHLLSQFE